jgi:hypothetical protein
MGTIQVGLLLRRAGHPLCSLTMNHLSNTSVQSTIDDLGLKPGTAMRHSFDEFKLYYDSAEKVTDRRIANNQWNYSICVATIAAMALVWSWSANNRSFAFLSLTVVAALSSLGILFSTLWIRQIADYKSLNAAKFSILNDIAPSVAFPSSAKSEEIVSSNPFKREWEALQKMDALREVGSRNLIALKSSNIEFYLPKALRFLYVLSLMVSVAPILRHIGDYGASWANWLHLLTSH